MDSMNVVEMLSTILIQGDPYFVIFLHAMIFRKHRPKIATHFEIGVKRLIFHSNYILCCKLDTSNSIALYGKNKDVGIFLELYAILSKSISDIAIISMKSLHGSLSTFDTCKMDNEG